MSKSKQLLSVKSISKKYSVKTKDGHNEFWALKNISFDLEQGKVLGIIGGNGAGKSTLLKILSEIIPPTSGTIEYEGNILSILEVGTGFHPDLSGYDNIFLNASLLGMKKAQIQNKVEEIIEFSGIKDFINEPVKTYSSGMYLRLALSIALFTDNQILLLDEVVSVGDAEFRYKAVQKIKELVANGTSCIMISHDLNSIIQLCDSCIVLDKGEMTYLGNTNQALEDYNESILSKLPVGRTTGSDHDVCKLVNVDLQKNSYFTDEAITLKIKYELKKQEDIVLILRIRQYQNPILTDSLAFRPNYESIKKAIGMYEAECTIPANLLNAGNYIVDLILGTQMELFINLETAAKFTINHRDWEVNKNWNSSNVVYPIRPQCNWTIKNT